MTLLKLDRIFSSQRLSIPDHCVPALAVQRVTLGYRCFRARSPESRTVRVRAPIRAALLAAELASIHFLALLFNLQTMAKATPLQKSRPGLPLAVLAAVGVVFGVAIHIQDLHRAPGHNAAVKKLNGQQLQARLGVDYGSYKPLKLLFILVNFFEHALRERTSVGVSGSASRAASKHALTMPHLAAPARLVLDSLAYVPDSSH